MSSRAPRCERSKTYPMCNQASLGTFQSLDNTLERCSNVCEVGNTTSNDKDLAVWSGRWACDQVDW